MVNAYFANRQAVWLVTVQIAQIENSSGTATLSAVPHLDGCLQNPLATFHTSHAPSGAQSYNAVLYAEPPHQQQYAHQLEKGKCFRALFTATFQLGGTKEPQTAFVDSVEKVPDESNEPLFRYRIFASSAVKPTAGSKLKLSLVMQTPEGSRHPAGFIEPLANRWIATEYAQSDTATVDH